MDKDTLTIGKAIFLTVLYFGIMLFYTFLDVAIWRKISPDLSPVANIFTIIACIFGFLLLLKKQGFSLQLFANVNLAGILFAVGCSVLFFLLLNRCLDPIFESLFPQSEGNYQETIQSLLESPMTSFLQVCLLAPVIEEILMRSVVLGGLKKTYGTAVALLVSAALFALLHFNMVQTLSAFVCGIFLGILYLKTDSVFCCILAHSGYNLIAYITIVYPN